MDDDDINLMLERINEGGIPETQIRHILEFLGVAEALNAEVEAMLAPFQRGRARKEIGAAMLKVFQRGL